jgi:hypothetical protein
MASYTGTPELVRADACITFTFERFMSFPLFKAFKNSNKSAVLLLKAPAAKGIAYISGAEKTVSAGLFCLYPFTQLGFVNSLISVSLLTFEKYVRSVF